MKTSLFTSVFVLFFLIPTHPVRADVRPGQVRTVQSRNGGAIRAQNAALAPLVTLAPYGTVCTITEVEAFWCHVTCGPNSGWIRCIELVAPGSLTGPSPYGPRSSEAVAGSDTSAGGRQ